MASRHENGLRSMAQMSWNNLIAGPAKRCEQTRGMPTWSPRGGEAPGQILDRRWVDCPSRPEFRVTFGATASSPNEIAILSRSIVRILSELSTFVEVPMQHLANGSAPSLGELPSDAQPPFRVLSSDKKPCDPFVAICYEGHWFWIEKSDFFSKRTLSYLLGLLALADTGAKESLPVITIQAN